MISKRSLHKICWAPGSPSAKGCNLDQLGSRLSLALPLRLHGGDGSPARAIAIEGDIGV
jgi:kynurenine formamidase